MTTGYPNAEQKLTRIRDSGKVEDRVRTIIDALQEMGEQIRFQFRNLTDEDRKITSSIRDAVSELKTAIGGKVSKAGDTMTGNLLISKSGAESDFAMKRTDVTIGTAPAADTFIGATAVYDSANKSAGYMGVFYRTSKFVGTRLLSRNWNGSTNYSNYVDLYIGETGAAAVSMSHPAAWRTALQIVPFKTSAAVLSGSYIRYPAGSSTNSNITADHIGVINPYYTTGNINTYFFTCQCADGYANIYVRDKDGNQVAAGTSINLAGIFIKP